MVASAACHDQQTQLAMHNVSVMLTILGSLGGVLIGAYITDRNRRKQWLADNKEEEYRELISIMTRALSMYIHSFGPAARRDEEERRSLGEMEGAVLETIRDRLFIAKQIAHLGVLKRWNTAVRDFEERKNTEAFARSVGKLLDDISDAAIKDVGV